jgi:hypothetical protein
MALDVAEGLMGLGRQLGGCDVDADLLEGKRVGSGGKGKSSRLLGKSSDLTNSSEAASRLFSVW